MSEVIDMIAFNEAKAVMRNKFTTIIQYFIEDSADYIKTIKSGLDHNDISSVATASHTLKSTARQIGASRLSKTAADIEEASRNGSDKGTIIALVPNVERAYTETTAALSNI